MIDKTKITENELNPQFYKMYELDACLPHDWTLNLNIRNAGGISDELIGCTSIDFEDRYFYNHKGRVFGEQKIQERLAFQYHLRKRERQLEEVKFKHDNDSKEAKKVLGHEISILQTELDGFTQEISIPSEFKELRKKGKATSQGCVQILLEPFPLDLNKLVKTLKIEQPKPQEFEIRVVIWETHDIPMAKGKKKMDIYIKGTLDATATGINKEITLETDSHMVNWGF